MPKPLFQAEQNRLLVTDLGKDDAIWMQTDAGERGGEQVARPQAPQDRARHPGEDASSEQRRGGAVNSAEAAAGYLMECAAR